MTENWLECDRKIMTTKNVNYWIWPKIWKQWDLTIEHDWTYIMFYDNDKLNVELTKNDTKLLKFTKLINLKKNPKRAGLLVQSMPHTFYNIQ